MAPPEAPIGRQSNHLSQLISRSRWLNQPDLQQQFYVQYSLKLLRHRRWSACHSRRANLKARSPVTAPDTNSRTKILLVESETIVSLYARGVLEDAGFEVIEAWSASGATARLTENPDIAILLTTADLPGGIDGVKLAAQVSTGWPPVRIVVTSGSQLISDDDLPPQSRFLPKPYSESELLATLRLLEKQWRGRLV